MTYPQIKKTKEVGLNISCEGFMSDCQDAISRSAEACRVGTPLESCYYMQRVHLVNILRAYSMLPGMKNNMWDLTQIKCAPLELFGVPDTLPVISLLSKGDTTIARLKACETQINDILSHSRHWNKFNLTLVLKTLYQMQVQAMKSNKGNFCDYQYGYTGLYAPIYTYNTENKFIGHIRTHLATTYEECQEFIDNHPAYMFLKPNDIDLGWQWLHYMYYSRSFAKAYSRESRASLTLRLSRFTTSACILHPDFSEYESRKVLRIQDFMVLLSKKIDKFDENAITPQEWHMFTRSCMSGDTTVTFLYNFANDLVLKEDATTKLETTSVRPPYKIGWLKTSTEGLELLQYCVSPEDYIKDARREQNKLILDADKEKIESFYNINLEPGIPTPMLALLAKDILAQKKLTGVYMACSYNVASPELYLLDVLKHRIGVNRSYKVYGVSDAVAVDPYLNRTLYKRKTEYTLDPRLGCLDTMLTYYGFLKHTLNLSLPEIRMLFKNLQYRPSPSDEPRNVLDILANLQSNDPSFQGLKHYQYKTIAFLKISLLGDLAEAIKYIQGYMGFSYSYERVPFDSTIETRVTINFMNKYFQAIEYKTGELLLKTETRNRTLNWVAFVIALKLCSRITQSELELQMKNIEPMDKFSITTQFLKNLSGFSRGDLWLLKAGEQRVCTNLSSSFPEEGEPFILSTFLKHELRRHGKLATEIVFCETTSSLLNGKLKLFTAPFLQVEAPGRLESTSSMPGLHFYKSEFFLNTLNIYRLISNQSLRFKTDHLKDFCDTSSLLFKEKTLIDAVDLLDKHFVTADTDLGLNKLKAMLESTNSTPVKQTTASAIENSDEEDEDFFSLMKDSTKFVSQVVIGPSEIEDSEASFDEEYYTSLNDQSQSLDIVPESELKHGEEQTYVNPSLLAALEEEESEYEGDEQAVLTTGILAITTNSHESDSDILSPEEDYELENNDQLNQDVALVQSQIGTLAIPGELLDEEIILSLMDDAEHSETTDSDDSHMKFDQTGFAGIDVILQDTDEDFHSYEPFSVRKYIKLYETLEKYRYSDMVNLNIVNTLHIDVVYDLLHKVFDAIEELAIHANIVKPSNHTLHDKLRSLLLWVHSASDSDLQLIKDHINMLAGLASVAHYAFTIGKAKATVPKITTCDLFATIKGRVFHGKYYQHDNKQVIDKMKEKHAVFVTGGDFYDADLQNSIWLENTIPNQLSDFWLLPITKLDRDDAFSQRREELLRKYISKDWHNTLGCVSSKAEVSLLDFLDAY